MPSGGRRSGGGGVRIGAEGTRLDGAVRANGKGRVSEFFSGSESWRGGRSNRFGSYSECRLTFCYELESDAGDQERPEPGEPLRLSTVGARSAHRLVLRRISGSLAALIGEV